ncbi:MAG TPA: DUF1345 domain-containing protein [Xanthobacteraceae bacterium]|jgi:uncharacterized membrane protein|nr:DUF1345 domain-containing protein [Xanthobacteraceae bacterium]
MARSNHPLHIAYRSLRARPRMMVAALFGLAAALFIPADDFITHALLGWNAGVLLFIVLILAMMARTAAAKIRDRSIAEAEGRFTVLTLVIMAAAMILIAIALGIFSARELHGATRAIRLALTFVTVINSWVFVHIIFTIYYAHEYHAELKGKRGKPRGGLKFAGDELPDYWDFLYFSLTVGMTAQTSDTAVESRRMRRLVIVHGLVSFVFTTAVIALTVNLAAQLLQ